MESTSYHLCWPFQMKKRHCPALIAGELGVKVLTPQGWVMN